MSLDHLERRIAARVADAEVVAGEDPAGLIARVVAAEAPVLSEAASADLVRRVRDRVVGMGPLQPLLDDPRVDDVLIDGPGPVWVEVGGRLQRTSVVVSEDELLVVVERMLGPLGLRLDHTNAIVDARLADGSRLCVVGAPVALHPPCVAIRRFRSAGRPVTELAAPPVVDLLVELVESRSNLVVVGATGAGKTTLLDGLCALVPAGERVVAIEDTAELRLERPAVVRLESRAANAEGAGEVTIRQLVRAALRLRPDRLVVGEVRGAEALDMVWALASGHDGSMSTCHASSALEALVRLETFALMANSGLPLASVRVQVRTAIDVLVGVARGSHGERRVVWVAEVDPHADLGVRPLAQGDTVLASPTRLRRARP